MGITSSIYRYFCFMSYSKGNHTTYHHRYHIVWITKYRYKILTGRVQKRVRSLIAQVATEMNIKILNGLVSNDHIHIFCSIPPHIAVSGFVKKSKGRSSRKVQQEFPELRNRYWGKHFWSRGYFSSTSGNVTDEVINEYINNHFDGNNPENEANISLE